MYICICYGVTDSKIKESIDNGAQTMRSLTKELKVGSQCGLCRCSVKKTLNNHLVQIAEAEDAIA